MIVEGIIIFMKKYPSFLDVLQITYVYLICNSSLHYVSFSSNTEPAETKLHQKAFCNYTVYLDMSYIIKEINPLATQ